MNASVNYVTLIILKINIILYASYIWANTEIIFQHATAEDITFNGMSLPDKFVYLMKDCQMEVSKYISEAWKIRQLTI